MRIFELKKNLSCLGMSKENNLTTLGKTQAKNKDIQPDKLGIHLAKPKFPQYAVLSNRLESFKLWPKYIPIEPQVLAEAGFIYGGSGDSVKCYYCGGGLRYWEPEDKPWEEHAKWYPSCPHVALNKGKDFIKEIQAKENGEISADSAQTKYEAKPKVVDPMESLAVAALRDFGVSEELIKQAIFYTIKNNNNSKDFKNVKGQDLMEIVCDIEDGKIPNQDLEENHRLTEACHENTSLSTSTPESQAEKHVMPSPENLEVMQRETERLKEEKNCKICLDSMACVIFLPCGHMVSCPQCAPALYSCPLCRKDIKGTVKAFFA